MTAHSPAPGLGVAADHEAAFAKQLHGLVRDLISPDPRIYWADFLITTAIGSTALLGYLLAPTFSALQIGCFLLAGFALYRNLMFIHELAHLPQRGFRNFRIAWNLLAGIPMMTPEFLYAEHRTHHVNHSYGTAGDAEYVAIGRGPVSLLYAFAAQGLVMPILAVVRFGLLAPVSLLHPGIRRFVWERASGLTQNNTHFRRPWPKPRQMMVWGLQEAGSCLVVWCILGLMIAGVLSWWVLLQLYCLFCFVTTVSYARALASHLYWNEGQPMTYQAQMLDSTTIPGNYFLTELWAPLGQRYHALHHLIPSLPYYNLGPAHRRLLAALPPDSPYRQTIRASLFAALWDLHQRAKFESQRRKLAHESH